MGDSGFLPSGGWGISLLLVTLSPLSEPSPESREQRDSLELLLATDEELVFFGMGPGSDGLALDEVLVSLGNVMVSGLDVLATDEVLVSPVLVSGLDGSQL